MAINNARDWTGRGVWGRPLQPGAGDAVARDALSVWRPHVLTPTLPTQETGFQRFQPGLLTGQGGYSPDLGPLRVPASVTSPDTGGGGGDPDGDDWFKELLPYLIGGGAGAVLADQLGGGGLVDDLVGGGSPLDDLWDSVVDPLKDNILDPIFRPDHGQGPVAEPWVNPDTLPRPDDGTRVQYPAGPPPNIADDTRITDPMEYYRRVVGSHAPNIADDTFVPVTDPPNIADDTLIPATPPGPSGGPYNIADDTFIGGGGTGGLPGNYIPGVDGPRTQGPPNIADDTFVGVHAEPLPADDTHIPTFTPGPSVGWDPIEGGGRMVGGVVAGRGATPNIADDTFVPATRYTSPEYVSGNVFRDRNTGLHYGSYQEAVDAIHGRPATPVSAPTPRPTPNIADDTFVGGWKPGSIEARRAASAREAAQRAARRSANPWTPGTTSPTYQVPTYTGDRGTPDNPGGWGDFWSGYDRIMDDAGVPRGGGYDDPGTWDWGGGSSRGGIDPVDYLNGLIGGGRTQYPADDTYVPSGYSFPDLIGDRGRPPSIADDTYIPTDFSIEDLLGGRGRPRVPSIADDTYIPTTGWAQSPRDDEDWWDSWLPISRPGGGGGIFDLF